MSKSKAIAFALVLALTVGLLPVTSLADEAGAVPDATVTEEANDVSPQEEADPENSSEEKSSEDKSSEENSSEQEEKKEENSETESKQEETNDADSVKESDQTRSEQGQKGDPEETASTEDSNDKETSDMYAGDSSETSVSQPKKSETVQTVPRTEANNKLDLSDLNSGIAAAEALVEKEYTVKSWAALQEALSAAKDLAARAENDPEKVTQEEINSAAKALKDAVDALVKAGDIFVNMNVPFADFYGDNSIDAVSTATSKGKLNSFLKAGTVYGSYTEGDGTIRGIVVPVKMTADQFDELTGKVSGNDEDFFISAPLTEEPAVYLELKDTSPSFSSIKGKETKEGTLTVEKVEYATKRRDIQIKLTEKIMPASDVYGAYMTMTDGSVYPLLQIASIYKADSMYEYGWSLGEMTEEVKDGTKVMDLTQMYISTLGKTIDTVTYITKDGLKTYGLTYNNEKITIGEKPSYVLMNIPYDEFYANENGAVDSISSATLKGKARNINVNGASYHQSEEAVTSEGIKGAMYPVRVDSMADLEALGGKKITDDDKVTYTMNVRGKDTEFTLEGKDALQEAPSYSYYVLSEAPSHYKTLTVADGKASFSAASGKAATGGEITGEVTMGARHADVEIALDGVDVTPSDVSAVVMTADDGKYALHHVVNIWRGTEIGWNTSDIDLPAGTKITNVRYYLKDGTITDYPADITIGEMPSYVLMNIPYDEFYANEDGAVDGISSATLKGKARNINVNGASYHQSEEAVTSEGIKGAMYPVKVSSLADLEALGGKQVTDDDEVSYILSARGTQTEVSLKGRDALQEAPSYSYYVLSEAPSSYKTLTVEDGKASFSAASGRAATGSEITGEVTMGARHADVEIKLSGLDVTPSDVSAVVMTADDGKYALHHVVNIWRGTEIGWNTSDIDLPAGTKITNVRYYLKDGTITDYPADITIGEMPSYVLMNIPYDEFYANENGAVDGISSATLKGKARNVNVNGASYHQSEEAVTSEGIKGAMYPVKVSSLADLEALGGKQVTDDDEVSYILSARGTQTEVSLKGRDALQEAPSYSYYVLSEAPSSYKTLTVEDGKASFSAASGKAATGGEITGEVTMGARHADVEIALDGVDVTPSDVSAVVMTADDGKYALHHVVNIWRGTEIGWNTSDIDLPAGTKITNVRYYLKDGTITDYPADITIGEKPSYVLMNIPYEEFYANENGAVDSISSATLKGKARNVNVNGASYHQSEEAVTSEGIKGAMYPVRVDSMADLEALGGKQVTDDDEVSYILSARGTQTEVSLKGRDALQEAPSYSYYVLSEAPSHYKTLTLADGKASFSAASGKAAEGSEVTGEVTMGARHADVEIALDGVDVTPSDVSAVVMTAGDGKYALHHVVNIWRGTEIGWNTSDIDLPDGTRITNVRYYLKDGSITDYPADITIGEMPSYVLMNIPYDEFYANENGAVDGISSATLKGKARNVNVNGASYHQSEEAVTSEGIKGAMYPVRVDSMADLEALGGKQVTDDDEVSYILSARGTQTEVSLKGRDALQEAPSYSYYVLPEAPSHYKTLTVADGKASFSAASGKAAAGSEITGEVTMGARHADVEIKLSGLDVTPSDVSAVVMTADDGKYALHHVVNIWRGTEIGWNTSDIDLPAGTKITNVRYYLKDGTITDYPADITIGEMPSYVLMNIPYDEFYANENGAVDSISSATLKGKARNVNVNGASYHQSEEAVTSEGIKGAMYPVRVDSMADLEALGGKKITDDDKVTYTMNVRGKDTEFTLEGKDALQEAPSYSYYVLSEAPSHYKTLTLADGKASFSAASGKAAAGSEITGDVTMGARHADVEIKLSGLDVTPSDVSAVIMTADGGKYALHHVVNIWRGTEIGWNTSDINLPVGTKITNVRYYLKDGTITDYPANIELKVAITAEAEDGNTVKINGLPSNIADAKATVTSVDGENTVTFAEAAEISDGKTALTKELEDGREYTVAVSSSNYPDLTAVFTYKVDKTALQEQIKTPEALTQSDYTEESWKAVEDALKEARSADEKEHAAQSEIDKAEKALKDAIDALVKKTDESGTNKTDESGESKTSDNKTDNSSNSKTDQSNAGKSGNTDGTGKTAETAAVDYKIIEGTNSTWTKGSSKGLLIVSNAPFDKFDSVIVDNKEIASTSYKAEEGSTEITLLPEYLEKLTIGKHSFTIQSTDGSASTKFTIAKKAGAGSSNGGSKSSGSKGSSAKGSGSRSSAKTSDDNMGRILLYAALVIVSISAIVWLSSKKRKKI